MKNTEENLTCNNLQLPCANVRNYKPILICFAHLKNVEKRLFVIHFKSIKYPILSDQVTSI